MTDVYLSSRNSERLKHLASFGCVFTSETDRINVAFIYGSVAQEEDRALSDVDLIVVGRIGLSNLSKVLRPLESRFGREFNAICCSSEEFRKKLSAGNHFLSSVLKKEKTFLVGDANELDKLAGK